MVQPGDTLWDIAAEELGDGERYHEIFKINKALLSDAGEIMVGMSLKLPHR